MLQSLAETVSALAPIVFPLVFISQLLLGLLGYLIKLLNRPKINLYPSGQLEISFDQLGPSATLFGTMQAQRGDFFITKIDAVFRQPATGFERTLEWRAFKPYIFGLQLDEDVKYELVAAFALKASAPFKYNIVFMDDTFINHEMERVRTVINAWHAFQTQAGQALTGRALVEAFYNQPDIQAVAQAWRERMYWTAGAYQVDLQIHSGKRKIQHSYHFTLAETDITTLQSNVRRMIFSLCGERVIFGRAFTPYLPAA